MDGEPDLRFLRLVEVHVQEIPLDFGFEIPKANIIVDGMNNDWAGINPVMQSPQYDSNCGEGTDVKNGYLATDGTFIYWRMDTWSGKYKFDDDNLRIVINFETALENWYLVEASIEQGGLIAMIVASYPGTPYNGKVGGPRYVKVGEMAKGEIPISFFSGHDFKNFYITYQKINWESLDSPLCDK